MLCDYYSRVSQSSKVRKFKSSKLNRPPITTGCQNWFKSSKNFSEIFFEIFSEIFSEIFPKFFSEFFPEIFSEIFPEIFPEGRLALL